MTRAEIQAEYYRRNFEVFCREQLRISTPRPGELVPLVFNRPQRMLLEKIERQRKTLGYIRYCCCKSRQSTMSTFAEALCFHSTVLTPQFNSLLIANDDKSTADIFEMSKRFVTHLSEAVRPMLAKSNKQELVFENPDAKKRSQNPGLGSRLVFQSARTITAGTGSTRHALHLSEISKWDEDWVELLFSSIVPAIHLVPGTIVIKESTPYVGGTPFREMCEEARAGRSADVWHFIPWWFDEKNTAPIPKGHKQFELSAEERALVRISAKGQKKDQVPPFTISRQQLWWRRLKISELKSEQMFQQEYPPTFEDGWINLDSAVFDHLRLDEMKAQHRCKPSQFIAVEPGPKILTLTDENLKDVRSTENYIAVWKTPERGVIYDIGVDVSVGSKDDNDWSVAEVLRRDTREQVCELHLHMDPRELGDHLFWLGRWYNDAQLCVEINGPGYSTHSRLTQLYYPYLYIWRHRERMAPTLSTYVNFRTTYDSKQMILGNTVHRFNHREMILHSRVLIDQMADYVQVGGGIYRAANGNDDAVMGLMLAIQAGEDEGENDAAAVAAQLQPEEPKVIDPALTDDFNKAREHHDAWSVEGIE